MFRNVRVRKRLDSARQTIRGVASEGDFAIALRRERDRADRILDGFALVAIDIPAVQLTDPGWSRRLERVLRTRMRSTDVAGWLPEGRLGVVLPHTTEPGAHVFVDSLKSRLENPKRRSALIFEVFTYFGGRGPTKLASPTSSKPSSVPSGARRTQVGATARALSLERMLFEPLTRTKRALDVVLAVLGMIVASPVLLLAAIAIKCTSCGPVLFRQVRAGLGGRPFVLYKLRTMVPEAEAIKGSLRARNELDGPVFKMSDDPRITPIGRILRKLSIDELPQLWNVLRGEMSIVGPRPPTLDEVEKYDTWQRRRLDTVGGLTCFWQVNGRNNLAFLEWMRLDLRYLSSRSLGLDLLLILKTIPAVLSGRGAK